MKIRNKIYQIWNKLPYNRTYKKSKISNIFKLTLNCAKNIDKCLQKKRTMNFSYTLSAGPLIQQKLIRNNISCSMHNSVVRQQALLINFGASKPGLCFQREYKIIYAIISSLLFNHHKDLLFIIIITLQDHLEFVLLHEYLVLFCPKTAGSM